MTQFWGIRCDHQVFNEPLLRARLAAIPRVLLCRVVVRLPGQRVVVVGGELGVGHRHVVAKVLFKFCLNFVFFLVGNVVFSHVAIHFALRALPESLVQVVVHLVHAVVVGAFFIKNEPNWQYLFGKTCYFTLRVDLANGKLLLECVVVGVRRVGAVAGLLEVIQ